MEGKKTRIVLYGGDDHVFACNSGRAITRVASENRCSLLKPAGSYVTSASRSCLSFGTGICIEAGVGPKQPLLRSLCIVVFLSIVSLALKAHCAESPASVAGGTFQMIPTNTVGHHIIIIADTGANYTKHTMNAVEPGTLTYMKTGPTTATLTLGGAKQTSYKLYFGHSDKGGYSVEGSRSAVGEFSFGQATAPQKLTGKVATYIVSDFLGYWKWFTTNGCASFVSDHLMYEFSSPDSIYGDAVFYTLSRINRSTLAVTTRSATWYYVFAQSDRGHTITTRGAEYQWRYGFELRNPDPVVITKQPASQTVPRGGSLYLETTVRGTPPISFQWYHNESPIKGATSASYFTTNTSGSIASAAAAGQYYVRISNPVGVIQSSTATIKFVCTYNHEPGRFYPPEGTQGAVESFEVLSSGDCEWRVWSTNDWITVDASTNKNVGNVSFSVQTNSTGQDRIGYIAVGPSRFTVAQYGASRASAKKIFNPDGNEYNDLLLQDGSGKIARLPVTRAQTPLVSLRATLGGRVVDVADFSGDSQPDILFQRTNRSLAVACLNGTNISATINLRGGTPAALGWKAVACADFDGDQKADILFQHDAGALALWQMNGTNLVGTMAIRKGISPGKVWRFVACKDVNHDGHVDILFQNSGNSSIASWKMLGTQYVMGGYIQSGNASGWRVLGSLENEDLVVLEVRSGQLYSWDGQSSIVGNVYPLNYAFSSQQGWKVVGPK